MSRAARRVLAIPATRPSHPSCRGSARSARPQRQPGYSLVTVSAPQGDLTAAQLEVLGAPVSYEVTLEPNNRPWLLVLDAASRAPAAWCGATW